jgi:hypothetical protein
VAKLEALGELFADLLGTGGGHGLLEFLVQLGEVDLREQLADGVGAHAGHEGLAVLVEGFAVFDFGQELALLQRGLAGIDDEVVLVVDDALELAAAHVEHEADARGHALVEPDVGHGHGQFDVAHALAAHAGEGHFDAAAIADDALVLNALILAAGAFPVTGRTEDTLAEQAAFFGLERAVVDRFRVLDFAIAPAADALRRGDSDADLVEAHRALFTHQFTKGRFAHIIW